MLSPFPPILFHHSNPNILSSLVQPCSIPGYFWGLPLHLLARGSRCKEPVDAVWSRQHCIWRHWLAGGICSLQLLPLPELQAQQRPLSCLEADSCCFGRQLLAAPLLAPCSREKEKPGMAACEHCQTLAQPFPWSSLPGSLGSLLTCLPLPGAGTCCGHSDQPVLRREPMAASSSLEPRC